MKNFDKAFLSSTYAPEALTLAAASAVIDFYKEHDVIGRLWEKGEYLEKGLNGVIEKHGVGKNVSLAGYPVRLMVNTHDSKGIQDYNLATLYQQEMFNEGILCFAGVLMLSYSHSREDLDCITSAFDKACGVIKDAVSSGEEITKFLRCKPGSPVFKSLRERNAVSN
jgi:glutamate-1-semialdehyde aminotransferase